jgi:hypothetical protein
MRPGHPAFIHRRGERQTGGGRGVAADIDHLVTSPRREEGRGPSLLLPRPMIEHSLQEEGCPSTTKVNSRLTKVSSRLAKVCSRLTEVSTNQFIANEY